MKRPATQACQWNAGTIKAWPYFGRSPPSARQFRRLVSRSETSRQIGVERGVQDSVERLATDDRFVQSGKLAATALRKLRESCIDQLTELTAKQPQPPADWRRTAKLNCGCADCRELAKFLKDKKSQVHRFPRRTDLRHHLHQQIDDHRIDCAHVTERRGRPYTLVCTKNQASFERALQQYHTDCALLQKLTAD